MRDFPTQIVCMALVGLTLGFIVNVPRTGAQSPDMVVDLAARINRERVSRGLVPFAHSSQLTAAAQGHANDIARSANYSHTGSDGSTATERIARAGYGKYSWGYRVGENWAHYRDTASAMAMWMESLPHRNNILHRLYREMGIGIASTAPGRFAYVVDFGAQPNVLPIFIKDGASETSSLGVTITLSDEQVMPNGDGANTIGHPVAVQVSDTADFASAKWQQYATYIGWTLTPGLDTKTVYVKYRDAKGRTATASDSILLNDLATRGITVSVPSRVALTITRTPRPTGTATIFPVPTESSTRMPAEGKMEAPTATPALTETPTELPAFAAATLTPVAVVTRTPEFNPIALCGFGVSIMLIVFAGVEWLVRR